jgi:hypothetical protein
MNRSRQNSETDSICSDGEPANQLKSTMGKMRVIKVKRPKCRTKFIVMASVASVLLLVLGIFLFFVECSEKEEKSYSGELCVNS